MGTHSRQALAAYGFFEDARNASQFGQDALLPFVLPAIAGKTGEIFSPEALAPALEAIFGPELVLPLAESLTDTLTRNHYLHQQIATDNSAVYVYTDKASEIPLTASVSRAEADLATIMVALDEFILATNPIRNLPRRSDIRKAFVEWVTTAELEERDALARELEPQGEATPDLPDGTAEHLALVFAAFSTWASKERESVFNKIMNFAELGLVIDVVSEIRVPTRKPKKVDLTVVLDSSVLLEIVGAAGPVAQQAAQRLVALCKDYKIPLITLSHLVDEMNEIAYSVLKDPAGPTFRGSVADAGRRYPQVYEILNRLNRAPDACVRATGITIVPYTQTHDVRANNAFTAQDIDKFSNVLPYDKTKPRMAQRDAWSLAYAVRRQAGNFTSNMYESKCVVVTRSRAFANTARKYLRDNRAYPYYAVIPVIEFHHFSTLFLLAFGSDASRSVLRAELVASCDRVVRASPGLTKKLRSILNRMKTLTTEQVEAALSDPATLTEFALVTGNDLNVVSATNGPALLEVIRNVTKKEEELRHRAQEEGIRRESAEKLDAERAAREKAEAEAAAAQRDADAAHKQNQALQDRIAEGDRSTVHTVTKGIERSVSRVWRLVVTMSVIAALLPVLDLVYEVTHLPDVVRWILTGLFGVFILYSTVAFFITEAQPHVLRQWLLKRVAARHLLPYESGPIGDQVRDELGL